MVSDNSEISGISSTEISTSSTTPSSGVGPDQPVNSEDGRTTTDTIAAITVAILTVIVIITVILLARAIRKRQQARRGRELSPVATVSTGIMGTGVAAYRNNAPMTWEPVNVDWEMASSSSVTQSRSVASTLQ